MIRASEEILQTEFTGAMEEADLLRVPQKEQGEDHQTDSSFSFLPHLEAKIRQTHNLARLLTKYADQLLEEYVSRRRVERSLSMSSGTRFFQLIPSNGNQRF